MTKREKNEEREHRIDMEVIVDAYGPEERAMGWYYYLQDKITFPFKARCIRKRPISPLRKDEEIVVEDMAPESECMHEMFVIVKWKERSMGLPLSQLEPIEADEETTEAVDDWRYWIDRGYAFG